MNIFAVAPKASQLYGYNLEDARYGLLASFYLKILRAYLDKGERLQAFSGGLLGADMVFAKVCADLRDREGASIFCSMYIPYADFDLMWDEKNRKISHELIRRMDSLKINKKPYSNLSISERNNWFISRCNVCLAAYNTGRNEVWRVMNESLKHDLKVFQFNFATNKVYRYKGVKTMTIDGQVKKADCSQKGEQNG